MFIILVTIIIIIYILFVNLSVNLFLIIFCVKYFEQRRDKNMILKGLNLT